MRVTRNFLLGKVGRSQGAGKDSMVVSDDLFGVLGWYLQFKLGNGKFFLYVNLHWGWAIGRAFVED